MERGASPLAALGLRSGRFCRAATSATRISSVPAGAWLSSTAGSGGDTEDTGAATITCPTAKGTGPPIGPGTPGAPPSPACGTPWEAPPAGTDIWADRGAPECEAMLMGGRAVPATPPGGGTTPGRVVCSAGSPGMLCMFGTPIGGSVLRCCPPPGVVPGGPPGGPLPCRGPCPRPEASCDMPCSPTGALMEEEMGTMGWPMPGTPTGPPCPGGSPAEWWTEARVAITLGAMACLATCCSAWALRASASRCFEASAA